MQVTRKYLEGLFEKRGAEVAKANEASFIAFAETEEIVSAVNSIIETQNRIMENWNRLNRIQDIISQPISIPNGTVGKAYSVVLDFQELKLSDLAYWSFEGLEEIGLLFDPVSNTISGNPSQSGVFKLKMIFRISGEAGEKPAHEKLIDIVVNPDPKSLWKDIPSNIEDPFWKEDDVTVSAPLGNRNIVVSSKRGRAHRNVGSFRDDDFSFKHFEDTGWSVVVVSDGAGSSPFSRRGSQLACEGVINYFETLSDDERYLELESAIKEYEISGNDLNLDEIANVSKHLLYKVTVDVHSKIREYAEKAFQENPSLFDSTKLKHPIEYFHATLIFALFKKYEFGWVFLTFGVGDCPIAVMDIEKKCTKLLNWLDVGEFGGGTRFITQPEIFHSKERPMSTRFNCTVVPDFSYLFLMTDGIYDPKFDVEANLQRDDRWIEFLLDIQGANDEKIGVDLSGSNELLTDQMAKWMEFWSVGNHDDRTLAIVF